MRAASHVVRAAAACAFAALGALASCSADVDLGGSSADASAPADAADTGAPEDAGEPLAECDPCLEAAECGSRGTCAPVGGSNGFCVTLCPSGAGCDNDDVCKPTTTLTGDVVSACVPSTGVCAPAPAPTSDGAPLEQCGVLIGPSIEGSCRSCEKASPTCQKNGCYGGWWCNTNTRRCQKPPSSC